MRKILSIAFVMFMGSISIAFAQIIQPEPDYCTIQATAVCDEYGAIKVNWTAMTTPFGLGPNSGRVVVRIDDTSNGWFGTGDKWWATNYDEFLASGQSPYQGEWTFFQ